VFTAPTMFAVKQEYKLQTIIRITRALRVRDVKDFTITGELCEYYLALLCQQGRRATSLSAQLISWQVEAEPLAKVSSEIFLKLRFCKYLSLSFGEKRVNFFGWRTENAAPSAVIRMHLQFQQVSLISENVHLCVWLLAMLVALLIYFTCGIVFWYMDEWTCRPYKIFMFLRKQTKTMGQKYCKKKIRHRSIPKVKWW
jgi:hypothetical protein